MDEELPNAILPLERWPAYTRKIPYGVIKTGYVANPENPLELIPNPEDIYWIEKAFDYLDAGSSLREVSEWLGQKIKRNLVHQTLNNLYKAHRQKFNNIHHKKTDKVTRPKMSRDTKKILSEQAKVRAQIRKIERLKLAKEKKARQLQPEDFDPDIERKEPRVDPFGSKPFDDAELETKIRVQTLFKPNPGPQTRFLQSTELEVLYGGAAGGEDKVFLPPPFAVMHQNKIRELLECPKRENQQPSFLIRD